MLDCQVITENDDIFICKKMGERTHFKDFKIHKSQCEQCVKDEEIVLRQFENNFYFSCLISVDQIDKLENKEEIIENTLEYFRHSENDPDLVNKLKSMLFYFVMNPRFKFDPMDKLRLEYILNNIENLNLSESMESFINDDENLYNFYKKNLLDLMSSNIDVFKNSIKQQLEMVVVTKDFAIRFFGENKDKFDDAFCADFHKSLKEYDNNMGRMKKDPNFVPVFKVSLIDKIKGAKEAFKRIVKKSKEEGKDALWISEKKIIERQVCCTTCTDGGSCPYCGCQIKKSWFLPLGKSELSTEGCPNLNTYPHLKIFPSKNYWEVCEEKTSVIIVARNEENLNKTLGSLIANATGEIEILVGLDGCRYDVINNEKVATLQFNQHIGRRKISNQLVKLATGKYLFEVDAHCAVSYGWDTRLKCVCDDNIIVGCSVNSIDEKLWGCDEDIKWVGGKIIEDAKWKWDKIDNNVEKIEEVESFNACGWMIRKDYFEKLDGHDEDLGEWGWENVEWTLKNKSNSGRIIIRTDVIVSHLFRKQYPYEIKGLKYNDVIQILKNKDIYKQGV
jgi:hypothetical protein